MKCRECRDEAEPGRSRCAAHRLRHNEHQNESHREEVARRQVKREKFREERLRTPFRLGRMGKMHWMMPVENPITERIPDDNRGLLDACPWLK